ncbi:MAG: alpha-1,4-glucan--maltose-1-phosphate maltosyltransferase [Actinobacteria bacterium]|nr:alpha-1,4-glucan--maltose-1-phosphate maltosyltransferase [Actinomycetota bacterium]
MAKPRATDRRVVIESVAPRVDAGLFPAKCPLGDAVSVEADIFADGHDAITAVMRHRRKGRRSWLENGMVPLGNDRWRAEFRPDSLGIWQFEVEGWVDHFKSWREGLVKKHEAGVEAEVDLLIGSGLVEKASTRAKGKEAKKLASLASDLADEKKTLAKRVEIGLSADLLELMTDHPDRSASTTSDRYQVVVDREKAVFSTWYELFPRSWSESPGEHGTFADVEAHLPYVAGMGFDVLYLPPIHPIGTTHRKGPNNTLGGGPDDPGVPWAIGSADGGHTAIKRELGTIEDFRSLRDAAGEHGLELALDIAFQCSPDHPWTREHPEWFKHRPDGTIQYAENPPKKYQDIYPLDFETSDPEGLWTALKGVFDHWIDEGIRIFRVDNPHTKSFPFWEWLLSELRREHPDVILLSEAFTRPKVMHRLAKLGFNQSYTYFAWRNTRNELMEYTRDLAEVAHFFRPSFWPNTPDILTEQLQTGGRPAFITRYVLAATLSSNCGIYGPAYELMENAPIQPGSEEYLDSEKYQIRKWDLDDPDSLAPVITQVNQARRAHPALQRNRNLVFHHSENDRLLCYSKHEGDDIVLMVVNLDPGHAQSGWVHLDTWPLGLDPSQEFQVRDLLTERAYSWKGSSNYVELDPAGIPAHVFSVRRGAPTAKGR